MGSELPIKAPGFTTPSSCFRSVCSSRNIRRYATARATDSASATEDGSIITGNVGSNDSDADSNAVLTFSLNNSVTGLTLSSTGAYSFDPASYDSLGAGQTTQVIATYTVTDDQGDQSSTTLTLHQVTNEIQGSVGADTVTGTNANDAIQGFSGNDTLNGGAGSDIIKGGAGNDSIDGGADNDQLYGGDGNDTILGGTGNDLIAGDAGDDNLQGGDGNDTIRGCDGNDTIDGGIGNDLIVGGAGNDVMTGGLGSDVFKWEFADKGAKGAPATDTITDFNVAPVASGGDVLDLRDLLTAENHAVGTGNLASYLHFEKSGANTVVHVSSTGEFAAGFNAAKEVQTITLTGVDLIGTSTNDQQVIQSLLNNNKLITD